MIYVNIKDISLAEPHPDWIEGHNDYIEFDPKTTWYYQNIVKPKEQENQNKKSNKRKNNKGKTPEDEIPMVQRAPLREINLDPTSSTSSISTSTEENEPLSIRKRRLEKENEFEVEKGRPTSRIRRESENIELS